MHIVTRVGAAIVFCAATVTSAHAATLEFTLTGSRTARFAIYTDTPPDSTNVTGFGDQIFYEAVPGTYGGKAGTGEIIFGSGILANFQIAGTPLGFTQFAGPTLFTGALDDPQFSL